MIQNIVFDMGNVLMGFQPQRIAAAFADDPGDQKLFLDTIFYGQEWQNLDAGTFSEEDMRNHIRTALPERLVEQGLKLYENWHRYNIVIPEADKLVTELKAAGYPVYLLSNVAERFHVFYKDVPALCKLDGRILSAEVKAAKPGEKIYGILFETYDLVPETCYFVDDLEDNIRTAKSLGMEAFQLDHFQYDDLRADMRAHGIRI